MQRDPLAEARHAVEIAATALEAAQATLGQAAQRFAKLAALDYSAKHPRRLVTLCAAMGRTTLHVQPGGTLSYRDEYQFGEHTADIGRTPEFLDYLSDVEGRFNIQYALAGDILLECRGGEIISERFDW